MTRYGRHSLRPHLRSYFAALWLTHLHRRCQAQVRRRALLGAAGGVGGRAGQQVLQHGPGAAAARGAKAQWAMGDRQQATGNG